MVAMSLALIGLVAIQVHWIRNSIALREAQFGQSLDQALVAVSDRLERLEKLEGLRGSMPGQLLGRIGGAAPDSTILLGDDGASPGDDLLEEVLRGLLASDPEVDILQRVDPRLLDSLLHEELRERGVKEEFDHGIFARDRSPLSLSLSTDGDSLALAESGHRVRLYRNDLAGGEGYLHLHVPDQHRHVLRSMGVLLVLSALFLVAIVAAFVFTVRTIQRQKRLSRIRADLVNNMTHELKTPISTIALACEALKDPSMPRTEEQTAAFVNMIRDESKRLGVLVENVLQSAVLDSGDMRLKPVELDLHAVLRDVVRNTEVQVQRRNGRVTFDPQAEVHHVTGDRIHLTNVFNNLLDNAVKYTDRDPLITVRTDSDTRGITVHITDNGIGIPRQEQDKIFERLYRVSTGDVHNVKGFGLGLSYVRAVVLKHGGRIRLDSEPGRGSTFHITLPFHHVSTDQAPAR